MFGMQVIKNLKISRYTRLQTLSIKVHQTRMESSEDQAKFAADNEIDEGKAHIYQPSSVFYNPVQEFNRDLTVAVISEFAKDHVNLMLERNRKRQISEAKRKGIELDKFESRGEPEKLIAGQKHHNGLRILEGLAASGLRSIRFAKEIPGVKEIIANDFDKTAVEYIKKNIRHNEVSDVCEAQFGDAALTMYLNRDHTKRFDVIDLDPYGSPAHFLDGAVQSIRDGGLLCVTCTDMGVLCGNYGETCHAKYGSYSVRSEHCHEQALRILLRSIESHANRYSRYIQPLLSISADFYIRVFITVHSGQRQVKASASKLSNVFLCGGCHAFHLQPISYSTERKPDNYQAAQGPVVSERCSECNSHHRISGPIWNAPMHNLDFVQRVLSSVESDGDMRFGTSTRIRGMLSVIMEELNDVPLYYKFDDLMKNVHIMCPPYVVMRSAILHAGYRVSGSHAAKNAIKTDAPLKVLYDIVRCLAKRNPPGERHMKEGSVCYNILSKTCEIEANLEKHPDANPQSRAQKLLRYQTNPTADWGPKPRAKQGEMDSLHDRRQQGLLKAQAKKRDRENDNSDSSYYKQFDCKKFKEGQCEHGDDCKYSHTPVDQELFAEPMDTNTNVKKTDS